MIIEIELRGPSKKLSTKIKANAENVRQAIRQTFFRAGRDLKEKTRADINNAASKKGNWYFVYVGAGGRRLRHGRWHRASAPYQTHANLTGALRDSLGWIVKGTDTLRFGYGVTGQPAPSRYNAPPYARRIEFGGTDSRGIEIKKRPSLHNNIKKYSFQKYFEEAIADIAGK